MDIIKAVSGNHGWYIALFFAFIDFSFVQTSIILSNGELTWFLQTSSIGFSFVSILTKVNAYVAIHITGATCFNVYFIYIFKLCHKSLNEKIKGMTHVK